MRRIWPAQDPSTTRLGGVLVEPTGLCASRQAIRAVHRRGKVTSTPCVGPEAGRSPAPGGCHFDAMAFSSLRPEIWPSRRRAGGHRQPTGEQVYSAPIGALSPTLDAAFFALSDPKRRSILERLGRGPATLSQLAGPSGLTLNGIKKHVGILEFAGLVETEKVGRARECRLRRSARRASGSRTIAAPGKVGWTASSASWSARGEPRLRYDRLIQASPARVFDPVHEPGGAARVLRQRRAELGRRLALRAALRWRLGDRLRPVAGRALPAPAHGRGDRAPRRLLLATTETRLDGSRIAFSTEFTFAARDGATLMTMVQ